MIACLRPDYRLLDAVFGNFLLIMSGAQNIQSKKLSIIHRNDLFSFAFRLARRTYAEYLTRQAERDGLILSREGHFIVHTISFRRIIIIFRTINHFSLHWSFLLRIRRTRHRNGKKSNEKESKMIIISLWIPFYNQLIFMCVSKCDIWRIYGEPALPQVWAFNEPHNWYIRLHNCRLWDRRQSACRF